MAPRILRRAVAITIAAIVALGGPPSPAGAVSCPEGTGAERLTNAFAGGIEGLVGADYQRAFPLPDGRTLWTVQDAFLSRPGLGDRLVHNVGIVQDGACSKMLRTGSEVDRDRRLVHG